MELAFQRFLEQAPRIDAQAPYIFVNSDNSVDGQLNIALNKQIDRLLRQIGVYFRSPRGMWFSISLRFSHPEYEQLKLGVNVEDYKVLHRKTTDDLVEIQSYMQESEKTVNNVMTARKMVKNSVARGWIPNMVIMRLYWDRQKRQPLRYYTGQKRTRKAKKRA